MLCVHLASIFVRSEDGTIPDRLREHIISDGRRPAGRLRLGCPGVGVRVGEGPRRSGRGQRSSSLSWLSLVRTLGEGVEDRLGLGRDAWLGCEALVADHDGRGA
jgi:hypothetical protein